ncbi:hypothetical protein AB0E83_34600 [Streptomyces sp. NPDC035033]|uniref:hypothetical protein n=1 Tax=Streptomyces sp. NPDC035033 TaxID=3155368 RepID=UPI0033DDF3A3
MHSSPSWQPWPDDAMPPPGRPDAASPAGEPDRGSSPTGLPDHRPMRVVGGCYLLLAVGGAVFPTALSTTVAGHLSVGLVLVALQLVVMAAAVVRWRRRPATADRRTDRNQGRHA